jgi:hypothetical protein
MNNSPYLDRPLIPLAIALPRMRRADHLPRDLKRRRRLSSSGLGAWPAVPGASGSRAETVSERSNGRSRNALMPMPSRLISCQNVLFINILGEGLFATRYASFRPVAGRLGPKLGPWPILASPARSARGRGPPFKAVSPPDWRSGDVLIRRL